jgi:glycine cleavage system H protein
MNESIPYRRSRFVTNLPAGRRYTASHSWLAEESTGVWRIGFTKFAAWLLGDLVEYEFRVASGAVVAAGQEIGWVEGLKSLTGIYSVAEGEFLDSGDGISADITLIDSDPYQRGWLYRVRGTPMADTLDVHAYIALLDEAVDTAIRNGREECGGECDG